MSGEEMRATLADLLGVLPVLALTYGAVLGVVALVTGWQALSKRRPRRRRRGVAVPRVGAIAPDADTHGGRRGHHGGHWSCRWSMAAPSWPILWTARPQHDIGTLAATRPCAEKT
ncbi:MAG: hypothetical protein LC776_00150 [Acidobacteria bacterium]|nr:hypothetical protein [Acidobacteriota bacterium]